MSTPTYLVRTMSDTVETDIRRVHVVANEVLARYQKDVLSFDQLRKIADGPFDLFLIPLIFEKEHQRNPNIIYNEGKRQEIRSHALEIARKHGFDADPPDFIPGIADSLRAAQEAGLVNILMTTGGRRFKHRAMEKHGIGKCFEEIVDRNETYYAKEQGLYYLFRKDQHEKLRVILVSGTSSYIKAGNNLERCAVGKNRLEVCTVALSTDYSYNDEETLLTAKPKMIIHDPVELISKLKEHGLVSS